MSIFATKDSLKRDRHRLLIILSTHLTFILLLSSSRTKGFEITVAFELEKLAKTSRKMEPLNY